MEARKCLTDSVIGVRTRTGEATATGAVTVFMAKKTRICAVEPAPVMELLNVTDLAPDGRNLAQADQLTTAVAEARAALLDNAVLDNYAPIGKRLADYVDDFEAAVRASERARAKALLDVFAGYMSGDVGRMQAQEARDAARAWLGADGVASAGQAYEDQQTSLVQEGRESPTQD